MGGYARKGKIGFARNMRLLLANRNRSAAYGCGLIACLILLIVLRFNGVLKSDDVNFSPTALSISAVKKKPLYYLYGKKPDGVYLSHVRAVFERLGFARSLDPHEWDVLWAHDYPFIKAPYLLEDLKSNKKVNKWPGSGWVTNKGNLAKMNYSFIPKAFKIPSEKQNLIEFAQRNPGTMWVQKSNNHRGIRIKTVEELDLSRKETFVQQYISNPLLISKRKFDIGIYVVVTSIDPLRIYMFEGDCLLRFCAHDYYPFDDKDTKKYVVDDDYTPSWEIKEINKYLSKSFTFKQAIFSYFRDIGRDPEELWDRIRTVIRRVYSDKEHMLIGSANKYGSARYFFELVRFDFILDDALNLYLMEVNMSPNLSSKHFPPNALLYEQVLYNLMSLAGLACHLSSNHCSLDILIDEKASDMIVSDRDISVFPDHCASQECQESCKRVCSLCHQCLSSTEKQMLKKASREHISRITSRRVVPTPLSRAKAMQVADPWEFYKDISSESNKLMAVWFLGKCVHDINWCS